MKTPNVNHVWNYNIELGRLHLNGYGGGGPENYKIIKWPGWGSETKIINEGAGGLT